LQSCGVLEFSGYKLLERCTWTTFSLRRGIYHVDICAVFLHKWVDACENKNTVETAVCHGHQMKWLINVWHLLTAFWWLQYELANQSARYLRGGLRSSTSALPKFSTLSPRIFTFWWCLFALKPNSTYMYIYYTAKLVHNENWNSDWFSKRSKFCTI